MHTTIMKKILFALALLLGMAACTQDFEDLNANRNEPSTVTGDLLLPTVIFDLSNASVYTAYNFGDIISQYAANYEFNLLDIYNWTNDGRFWGFFSTLQNIEDIKAYGIKNNLPNYEATALILEAFCYGIMTDAYGDLPYTEANRAEEGIITPKYDTQEYIYDQMLLSLERANSIIDVNSDISGDILYRGDMSKWKKFANSLHVRLLMRTSNVRNISSSLQKIVDDPAKYPLFESNADAPIYRYSGVSPYIAPMSSGIGREYEYFLGIPTTHFINLLLAHDDPRIHEWLDEKVNTDGSRVYIGVAPGQNLGDIGRPDAFATKDRSYYDRTDKITSVWMNYSEVNFILAEATAKNIIRGDAKAYYDAAVTASFAQWDVDMPADFLTAKAPYVAGNLDRLYEQKWLALYHVGTEAWFDWKRTGKPSFIQAGPGTQNNGKIPVRLMYPSSEQSVNATNYQAAANRIGSDNINTRVWWDK
jgi:Starch-binding associating with outer membrane